MKHCITRTVFGLALLLAATGPADPAAAQDGRNTHELAAAVEITESAINQFIFNQWQIHDITQELSGEEGGFTYLIRLSPLAVDLRDDEIAVTMRFRAEVTDPFGFEHEFDFVIEPSASVPDLSIALSSITAFLENVPELIDDIDMPVEIAWIKPILIAEYEDLELTMYPSGILDVANESDWMRYRPLEVTDVSLTLDIDPGVMRIIPAIVVETSYVKTIACLGDDGLVYLKFNSLNCDLRLVHAKVSNGNEFIDSMTIHPPNPIELPRGEPIQIFRNVSSLASGMKYIWALFTTDDTFYVRVFSVPWINSNDHQICVNEGSRINY